MKSMPHFERIPRSMRYLDLGEFAKNQITAAWIHIVNNGIGEPIRIPVLVARGKSDGPIVGLTAALHGNELNGMAVIHRLFEELDTSKLHGTIIGVLCANVPGLLMHQRKFNTGVDLNHIAPGKANGNEADVYVWRLIDRIVNRFDYLVDLHTASFGRINSYYVRADMVDPVSARMARLQNPEIILHNPPSDTTLRGSAASLGIKSITVELRDPNIFQFDLIDEALAGVRNIFIDLNMQEGSIVCPIKQTILCSGSYWMYTDEGGILDVYPDIVEIVEKDQDIAGVRTIFGEHIKTFTAPERGVVIGRSVSPINQTGSRIIHLGLEPKHIPCITDEL